MLEVLGNRGAVLNTFRDEALPTFTRHLRLSARALTAEEGFKDARMSRAFVYFVSPPLQG